MAKQASRQAVVAYLRHRARAAIALEGVRPFARKVGVSHVTMLGIDNGTNALSKSDTTDALAATFGLSDVARLYAEAAKFAVEHPDLVAAENSTSTRVELDTVTNPSFGDLPGWKEAESEARRKYRYIPEDAWVGARGLAGMKFREQVTAENVLKAAQLWLDGQSVVDDRSGE